MLGCAGANAERPTLPERVLGEGLCVGPAVGGAVAPRAEACVPPVTVTAAVENCSTTPAPQEKVIETETGP
jgi:hypothetical protein